MQATDRAGRHDGRFRSLRFRASAVGGQGDEAVELAVEVGDPAEIGFGEFDRRQLAVGDEPGRLGDAQEGELRHDLVFSRQENRWHEDMRRLVAMWSCPGDPADHPADMAISLDQLGHILCRQNEACLACELDDFIAGLYRSYRGSSVPLSLQGRCQIDAAAFTR
jgi:hypothetical protein